MQSRARATTDAARRSKAHSAIDVASRLICAVCGDVAGVYEPLAVTGDGQLRVTSLASEPKLLSTAERVAHYACALKEGLHVFSDHELS